MTKFLIVSSKKWNDDIIKKFIFKNKNFVYHFDKKKLLSRIKQVKPKKIFFIHYSYKVPKKIFDKYECINFHMTDLPFGRGGSPLQNLILRGCKKTKLTAHKMVEIIDSGDIYMKRSLSLKGSAKAIYIRSTKISLNMIEKILIKKNKTKKQKGKITLFKRRTPNQSKIDFKKNITDIYDFIRMLDAPGYPKAFINYKSKKLFFTSASYNDKTLFAKITIKEDE